MSILRIDCASPSLPWFFLRKAPTSKGRLSVPRIITIQPASAKDGHVRLHYHRRRTGRPDRRNLLGQIYAFYAAIRRWRSEEHTSELQSLMRISYAVFCLKKKTNTHITPSVTTFTVSHTQ